MSLHQAGHTSNQVEDDRLKIDMSIVREMVDKGEIRLEWVEGANQISDVLTKKGAPWNKLCKVVQEGKF